MNAKIIAFYEDTWFGPRADLRLWDQTTRAYGADLQLIREWDEAIIPDGYQIIVLDESGESVVNSFTHPENAVYVFGRSNQIITNVVPSYDKAIKIDTPNAIPLFGAVCGGIVLQDRKAKGG